MAPASVTTILTDEQRYDRLVKGDNGQARTPVPARLAGKDRYFEQAVSASLWGAI